MRHIEVTPKLQGFLNAELVRAKAYLEEAQREKERQESALARLTDATAAGQAAVDELVSQGAYTPD